MKIILGVIGAVVLVVGGFLGYQYWRLQQAAVQWDSAEEIVSESIEQVDSTWKVHFTSVVDKPLDQVWQAVQQPERSSEFIDSFKKSELKKHEGNKKVIETHVQVLTLPLQAAVMEYTFDEAAKQVQVKTLQSATQNMNATLQLQASPDGRKTLLTYDAEATPKVSLPVPVSAQKGAMRELFVKTVQAIKKGIEEEEKRRATAGAAQAG